MTYILEGRHKEGGPLIWYLMDGDHYLSKVTAKPKPTGEGIDFPVSWFKSKNPPGTIHVAKGFIPLISPKPKQESIEKSSSGISSTSKFLTDSDFLKLADEFDVHPAAAASVIKVESSGKGFLDDGRPKILFEAHWFGYYSGDRFNSTYPTLSCSSWEQARQHYKGGAAEYERFNQACKLDRDAAIKASSWGLGQIMGFNFEPAGFKDLNSFFEAMHQSEYAQAKAMFDFIKSQGLRDELQRQDWAGFARGYNGEGYKVNRYDVKLAEEYHLRLAKFQKLAPKQSGVDSIGKKLLNSAWYPQTDNTPKQEAHRTCFSSSCAMLLKNEKPDALSDSPTADDEYIKTVFSIGDTIHGQVQVEALSRYGVTATFSKKLDFDDLDKQLDRNKTIPIGFLHHGTDDNPQGGGHWAIVRGRSEDGRTYYLNDPWGSLNEGYQGKVENGRSVGYSRSKLQKRWTVDGSNTGWGIIV